jgi:hypothetical protein
MRKYRTARRQLATIGVHHLNGNALRLDQVALWIDGSAGPLTRGIQPVSLCDERCHVALGKGVALIVLFAWQLTAKMLTLAIVPRYDRGGF